MNTRCALVVAMTEHTIQNGYRKCRTHARVLLQTLAHGNSKNEIRQRTEDRIIITINIIIIIFRFDSRLFDNFDHLVSQKKVPFSKAMAYWELMQEHFPKHSRSGTARMT